MMSSNIVVSKSQIFSNKICDYCKKPKMPSNTKKIIGSCSCIYNDKMEKLNSTEDRNSLTQTNKLYKKSSEEMIKAEKRQKEKELKKQQKKIKMEQYKKIQNEKNNRNNKKKIFLLSPKGQELIKKKINVHLTSQKKSINSTHFNTLFYESDNDYNSSDETEEEKRNIWKDYASSDDEYDYCELSDRDQVYQNYREEMINYREGMMDEFRNTYSQYDGNVYDFNNYQNELKILVQNFVNSIESIRWNLNKKSKSNTLKIFLIIPNLINCVIPLIQQDILHILLEIFDILIFLNIDECIEQICIFMNSNTDFINILQLYKDSFLYKITELKNEECNTHNISDETKWNNRTNILNRLTFN